MNGIDIDIREAKEYQKICIEAYAADRYNGLNAACAFCAFPRLPFRSCRRAALCL